MSHVSLFNSALAAAFREPSASTCILTLLLWFSLFFPVIAAGNRRPVHIVALIFTLPPVWMLCRHLCSGQFRTLSRTGVPVVVGAMLLSAAQGTACGQLNAVDGIKTVAGNDNSGYSGDGGPATPAALYNASALATDAASNLYIADRQNSRIRKVDQNGIITTMAGTGAFAFSGDGGPAASAAIITGCGADDGFGIPTTTSMITITRRVGPQCTQRRSP